MKKNGYRILKIILLFIMIFVMYQKTLDKHLWFDELEWTINSIDQPNLLKMIRGLASDVFNLPLYYIILYPVYKIIPYGLFYLLIPNIIITIFSVCIIGKIGDKIGGKTLELASLLIASTSCTLISRGTLEIRPYVLLFCLSGWVLYRYLHKAEKNSKKNIILYTISMILLSYTHWFGCLIIAFYFLVDTYLWIRKKVLISFIYPYLITGCLFLPWFFIALTRIKFMNIYYNWTVAPTFSNIPYLIKYILSFNPICITLFIIGFISAVLFLIFRKCKNMNIFIGSIIFVLSTIYIYSKYINPKCSLFVNRYFTVIMPHIFILTAIPISKFLKFKIPGNNSILKMLINLLKYLSVVCIAIIIGIQNYSGITENSTAIVLNQDYASEADGIIMLKGIYNKNNAVMIGEGKGFLKYFFIKRNVPMPQNVIVHSYRSKIMSPIVKNGKMIEYSYMKMADLLTYDQIYVYQNNKLNKDVSDYINKHYTISKEGQNYPFYVYKKRK